ncbi:serine/threonine-protein kinase [uncultured Desulfobulbus sp.]|uniref:serine/threonine protein kinase n=1 Tax=uncultured Desulfobulbus sp. TaxID=239745 RepID=UPI0029C84C28|nr:serine/threonine-protein kinase [uncultured Desulfobulbus sp.]
MSLGNIGKYEKLDVLGHGASGIVYLAWDTMLGKHVALKVISIPASEEGRFLEEARVLDRLRHPNIVQVNSVDRIDGHLIIDMEYVKGANLLNYMKQKGRMDPREALGIAVQVCDALDFAHRNHTIHRDIKPANILIDKEGNAKIVDFGLAEILGSGSYAGGAGTYAYMAPEDFEEEDKSDHRSDIWAIGVTLYEMLTGQRPFLPVKSKDPFSWKRTVEEDEQIPVTRINSLLPEKIEQVISKALAKDKYSRYQTAGEMRDDLKPILASMGGRIPLSSISQTSVIKSVPDEMPTDVLRRSDNGISADVDEVDFGGIRRDEPSRKKISIYTKGRGRCSGKIISKPDWIAASPETFSRRNQTIVFTASVSDDKEPGIYTGIVVAEVDGERLNIPVAVDILNPRPRFYQTAWWYVPLLLLCWLPLVIHHGGWLGGKSSIRPADMAVLGLLSVMLYIIAQHAELGSWERFIPALMAALGLGTIIGIIWQEMARGGILARADIEPTAISGSLLSFVIVIQLLTASKWKVWSWIMVFVSISATLLLTR